MADEIERKWTRGPWSVEGPDEFGDFNICPPHERAVVAAVISNVRPLEEVAANAALTAAAPDLYEALEKAHALIRNDRSFALYEDDFREVEQIARAALLRAHPQTEQQEGR